MNKKRNKNKQPSISLQLLGLIFDSIVLARTFIMFSFMGTHYWIGDYFTNALGQDGKMAKVSIYSFVSFLGPFLGSIVGASICEYLLCKIK